MPDCFSPSALGRSGDCKLRLVIASMPRKEWREQLASGPEAAVGTLLHRVLERAGLGSTSSVEAIFQEEYTRATDEIRRDPQRAHFAELATTKSLAEWTRVKAWVLARASRLSGTSTSRRPRAGGSRPALGPEVGLESRALRLRGKADKIQRLGPQSFEVRDFKTGNTLDERGEIRAEIAMQLQAYGLLLLERQRGAKVRLVVDDGEEREIPFDFDAQHAAKEVLVGITGSMPPAGRASARELTSPGPSCCGCPIRHVCPAYRTNAPGWWKRYPSNVDRLSNDVWGAALEVLGEGRMDLVLRDDAGRRVRIDGLEDRHGIAPPIVGKRFCFFGLEATGATRGFDGTRFHPRSFHELPRDRLERRAWAVQVFEEPSDPTAPLP